MKLSLLYLPLIMIFNANFSMEKEIDAIPQEENCKYELHPAAVEFHKNLFAQMNQELQKKDEEIESIKLAMQTELYDLKQTFEKIIADLEASYHASCQEEQKNVSKIRKMKEEEHQDEIEKIIRKFQGQIANLEESRGILLKEVQLYQQKKEKEKAEKINREQELNKEKMVKAAQALMQKPNLLRRQRLTSILKMINSGLLLKNMAFCIAMSSHLLFNGLNFISSKHCLSRFFKFMVGNPLLGFANLDWLTINYFLTQINPGRAQSVVAKKYFTGPLLLLALSYYAHTKLNKTQNKILKRLNDFDAPQLEHKSA